MSGSPTVTIPTELAERIDSILGSLTFETDECTELAILIAEAKGPSQPEDAEDEAATLLADLAETTTERRILRTELVQLAQLVDRGDRGAGSLARATRRAHDPTYTDQEAKF